MNDKLSSVITQSSWYKTCVFILILVLYQKTEVRLHGTNIENSPGYVRKKCPKKSDAKTIGENMKQVCKTNNQTNNSIFSSRVTSLLVTTIESILK